MNVIRKRNELICASALLAASPVFADRHKSLQRSPRRKALGSRKSSWLRLGSNFTYTDARFTGNEVTLPGNVTTTNAVIPGDPRTFVVTLRYSF